jgi:polyisoprenoid-binding protein YceI
MEVSLREPPAAEPRVGGGSLTIPVLGLECGNARMTESLRVALAATSHPDIRFEVTSVTLLSAVSPSDEIAALARGDLTVAGVTRPFEVRVRSVAARDGDLLVRGSASLRMTDFGVRPPSAFAGLIKARDEVEIGFDLVLAHTSLERYRRGEL